MARPQKPRSADEPPQSELQPPARDWREEPAWPATGGAFGDTLPGFVREISWLRWLGPLSAERRLTLLFVALAAVLFLPWLGATGLWDPWEVHYGEVAREMIARGDYVHPWWESAWFFSKPALDLWLMAAGMLVVRTNGPERWTGIFTEWGVRLPYAAITALGAVMIFVMANRLLSRRSAVLGTLAMLTSPLFVFLARQAVPDPVFVGLLEAAMACLMIVMFEEVPETEGGLQPRDGWAAAFYCFVGFATLSKGLLGFALPGAVAFMYCLVTGEWHRLRRLRLLAGSLIVLAICAPWYGTMFAFDGRDDEGKTFFERFIIHDHFKRLAVGVYTSTPGGDFVYFIEQIGYDVFPWVFALPGAAVVIAKVRSRPQTPRERALLFLLLWLLIGFSVFAFSGTKFHPYAFPALAPLLPLPPPGAGPAAPLRRPLAGAAARPGLARQCRRDPGRRRALRAGRPRPGAFAPAPDRHVRLQLRPALSGSGDGSAPDLHRALLRRRGGGHLALAARPRLAAPPAAALAWKPAASQRAAGGAQPEARGRAARHAGSAARSAGGGLRAGGAGAVLRRLLRLGSFGQALPPPGAPRSLFGVLS